MALLNNPWVVGIFSGIGVTAVTRTLFSQSARREYRSRITNVNREVLYALRPGISEGKMPTENVLVSLITATARKYDVNRSDVYQPKDIAEELIKEIMDSSFLSAEVKKSYCEALSPLTAASVARLDERSLERKLLSELERQRNQKTMRANTLLFCLAIGSAFLMVSTGLVTPNVNFEFSTGETVIIILLAMVLPTSIHIGSALLGRRLVKRLLEEHRARGEIATPRVHRTDAPD